MMLKQLQMEGVYALFFGPGDYSSLGVPGQMIIQMLLVLEKK